MRGLGGGGASRGGGGGFTKTVFTGTCKRDGAFGFAVDVPPLVEDGDIIEDPAISLANDPVLRIYVHKPDNNLPGTFETHRDALYIQEGKFIISCPGGEPGFPAWDYKIVMIQ